MAVNIQSFSIKDLALGVDQRSGQNNIQQGYAENLRNADTSPDGLVAKRKGYEGYYGYMPMRIVRVDHEGTNIYLTIDTNFDLDTEDTPIVVYGKLSSKQSGDFSDSDTAVYYSTMEATAKRAVAAGVDTEITIEATEHGFSTSSLGVYFLQVNGDDWEIVQPDTIEIDEVTYDITATFTTAESFFVYPIINDWSQDEEVAYSGDFLTAAWGAKVDGYYTMTIPAATHQVVGSTFIPVVYLSDSNTKEQVWIDDLYIDASSNVVLVSTEAFNGTLLLKRASNIEFKGVNAGTTTIEIDANENAYFNVSTYYIDGTEKHLMLPDAITYDASEDKLKVTLTTAALTDVVIHYETADIISNRLAVTDTGAVDTDYSDINPQMTVWGITHENAYNANSGDYSGHVTHIDRYKRSAEERVIAGLGGNLFGAYTYSEYGTEYKMQATTINQGSSSDTSTVLAPVFEETGNDNNRTAGTVFGDNISSNYAIVTSAVYNASGEVKYTLDIDNKVGSLETAIDITTDLEDYAVITGMPHSLLNGTFKIIARDDSENTITVANTSITDTSFDSVALDGRLGIFTDRISIPDATLYEVGDVMSSSLYFSGVTSSVIALDTSSDNLVVDGITEEVSLPVNSFITVSRVTNIAKVDDYTNFVVGDMCTIGDVSNRVRVTSINTSDSEITLDESLTLDDSDVLMVEGRWLPIEAPDTNDNIIHHLDANGYTEQNIIRSTIVSDNMYLTNYSDEVMKFDGSTIHRAGLFRWQPQMFVEVDTSEPVLEGGNAYTNINNSTGTTVVSTAVTTNIIALTDSTGFGVKDRVVFNGSSLPTNISASTVYYIKEISGNNIKISNTYDGDAVVLANSSPTCSIYLYTNEITVDNISNFAAGDIIMSESDSYYSYINTHSITSVDADNNKLFVSPPIAINDNDRIAKVRRLNYYFRLHAIDNNNNIISSAVTGSNDFYVDIADASTVNIKLVGLPKFHNYDYDRLELRIYRAEENTAFKLVGTKDVDETYTATYIVFEDKINDPTYLDDQADIVAGSGELPTTITNPLRAKYISSLNNQLLLANLKDYPEVNLQLKANPKITQANLDGITVTLSKDYSDVGTTTDMINDAIYEFVKDATGSISSISEFSVNVSSINTSTETIALGAGDNVFEIGDRVQFSTSDTLPTGLVADTNYYITYSSGNDIRVSEALGGTTFNFTDSGVGTTSIQFTDKFNVNISTHGLSAGNWIYLYKSESDEDEGFPYVGLYQVSRVHDANNIVLNSKDCVGLSVSISNIDYVVASTKSNLPVYIGEDDYNYGFVYGFRPPALADGTDSSWEFLAILRLANTINASMKGVDLSISAQSTFVPWIIANAGSEYEAGQIVLKQPKYESSTFAVTVSSLVSDGLWYAQDQLQTSSNFLTTSRTKLLPNRVIASIQNYPEVFDAPTGYAASSPYVFDINVSDGQEITGIIPFFAESVFSGGQRESILVIFKTYSVYLLDVSSGNLSRIETNGQGCTVPYSIASTKNGIMFANESGIYRLNKDLSIDYIGEKVERIWEDEVNTNEISRATGHHYAYNRKYKLSVPVNSSSDNSNVLVYDYENEVDRRNRPGAWSVYTNHAATGWCNVGKDAFFGTTNGQVFKVRNYGTVADYRDDASAVAEMIIQLWPMDFDLGGIRKLFHSIAVHYQMRYADIDGVVVSTAVDYKSEFDSCGTVTISEGNETVKTIKYALAKRRGEALQIKITDSTIDQPIIITGVDVEVGGIKSNGITERNRSS